MSYKSKRSKALDISKSVKEAVWERDKGCCILCGEHFTAAPNGHYISRANSGLGIEQNVVTLCKKCHFKLDQTTFRTRLLIAVGHYLELKYPGFRDEDRKYKKYEENQ